MQRIKLKVITRARKEGIEKISEDNYRIKVLPPSEKGKANKRIIELLSKEFDIKKRDIKITSGETSNRKIVEMNI